MPDLTPDDIRTVTETLPPLTEYERQPSEPGCGSWQ